MTGRSNVSNQDMRDWLSQYKGKRVSMRWDGGGDSGWGEFLIEGDEISETDVSEKLVEKLLDHMGYESFNGDPQVSGEIYYHESTESFTGDATESYDEWETVKVDLLITVPDHIWFDRVVIAVSFDDVSVRLEVTHGPISQDHSDMEHNLVNSVKAQLEDKLDDRSDRASFREVFERAAGKIRAKNLVFKIAEVEVENHVEDNKDFEISLNDILPVKQEEEQPYE